MTEFKHTVELLVWGFLFGYLWHPIWATIKKIISEARKAREEW